VAQVAAHKTELAELDTQVVTISFESSYWTKVWLEETQSPFPFLIDPEREAYRAYGLQASALRAWSPRTLWYYLKAAWQGRERLGKRGDTDQLGGDFIVDRQGIVRLAQPSHDPLDRPSVSEILKVLRELGDVGRDT
jgi:alkyl hydroperoxide reductase subunit AhpC